MSPSLPLPFPLIFHLLIIVLLLFLVLSLSLCFAFAGFCLFRLPICLSSATFLTDHIFSFLLFHLMLFQPYLFRPYVCLALLSHITSCFLLSSPFYRASLCSDDPLYLSFLLLLVCFFLLCNVLFPSFLMHSILLFF